MARMSGRMPPVERGARSDRTPVGIHIGLGMVAALAGVMLAAIMPASAGDWRLVPVAGALVLIGAWTVDPAALTGIATVTYLLVVGFLVDRYGVLTWHGTPDLYRLLIVSASAGGGLALGALRRWVRRTRPLIVPAGWGAVAAATSAESMFVDKEEVPGV